MHGSVAVVVKLINSPLAVPISDVLKGPVKCSTSIFSPAQPSHGVVPDVRVV